MEKAAVSRRLQHLNDTAHLLASASPAVSAHLMSEFHKTGFEHKATVSDAQRRKACGGCGTIYVPGWTSSVSIERDISTSQKRRKLKVKPAESGDPSSRDPPTISHPEINVNYTCWLCGRKLSQILQHGAKSILRMEQAMSRNAPATKSAITATSIVGAPGGHPSSTTANKKSRQRTRTRKTRGLQSMISQSQASATEGSKVSDMKLMDFLHTTP